MRNDALTSVSLSAILLVATAQTAFSASITMESTFESPGGQVISVQPACHEVWNGGNGEFADMATTTGGTYGAVGPSACF
jgi:hypothetical protein